MCGEKRLRPCPSLPPSGSPPRVRGKVRVACSNLTARRITPACAGKRRRECSTNVRTEDHPRVCGEKNSIDCKKSINQGSPPRVRGKAYDDPLVTTYIGITPACAGKRLKKAHKIKDFDPVPIRFHLVFRRFERWCSNLPTPDGNVPV